MKGIGLKKYSCISKKIISKFNLCRLEIVVKNNK